MSVPTAAGTMRAASAAADPPLDPPAVRSSAHGLPTWSVVPPAANSCVWLWPASTMPWPRRRRHTALSAAATLPSSMRLEAVSPRPAHGEEVLERERDPAHQRGGVAFDGQSRIGGPRQLGAELGIQARPRVDGPGRSVEGRLAAVARGDPCLARLEQLDGRQGAGAQECGGLEEAEVGGVAHGSGRYRQPGEPPSASSVRVDQPETRA